MKQYKTFSTMGKDDDEKTPGNIEIHRINSTADRNNLISNNKILVIDNYTDWCGPCKQCAPQFTSLAQQYSRPGFCMLVKENVEDNHGGTPVRINGVPCFHFYINGKFQKDMTITGADMSAVEKTIQQLLS